MAVYVCLQLYISDQAVITTNVICRFELSCLHLYPNYIHMKKRIFSVMEHYGMSATEFADTLGISRAALSSIKTERTQPTLTMVARIHERFPEVSLEWLISGQGEMLPEISHSQQQDLFGSPCVKSEEPAPYISKNASVQDNRQRQEEKCENKNAAVLPLSAVEGKNPSGIKEGKKVCRIILLYDDGSFDEYIK